MDSLIPLVVVLSAFALIVLGVIGGLCGMLLSFLAESDRKRKAVEDAESDRLFTQADLDTWADNFCPSIARETKL